MKTHEKEYQRIKLIEDEVVLLLSKNMSDSIRERILDFKEHIGEVLTNIEQVSSNENIDDLLVFLFGYNLDEIANDGSRQLSEFEKMIKEE